MNINRDLRTAFAITGLLGALAVALGALGAHALRAQVDAGIMSEKNFTGFETAVKYHMYHTLAMFAITLLRMFSENRSFRAAFYLFFSGIVFFSGSLYLLCTRELTGMEGLRALGPVTPAGGLLLIAGWLALCCPSFFKRTIKS